MILGMLGHTCCIGKRYRCAINGETAEFEGEQIEISPEKIKRLIATAYQAGMKNANETDMSVHVEAINEINGMIND